MVGLRWSGTGPCRAHAVPQRGPCAPRSWAKRCRRCQLCIVNGRAWVLVCAAGQRRVASASATTAVVAQCGASRRWTPTLHTYVAAAALCQSSHRSLHVVAP